MNDFMVEKGNNGVFVKSSAVVAEKAGYRWMAEALKKKLESRLNSNGKTNLAILRDNTLDASEDGDAKRDEEDEG